jgi:hypothetical protein
MTLEESQKGMLFKGIYLKRQNDRKVTINEEAVTA